MDYKDFMKEISDLVLEILGEGFEISLKTITKNNNVVLDGLMIRKEGDSISPTIYLNHYYQSYLSGENVIHIVNEIIELYEKNKVTTGIDGDFFTKYERVRERIVFKLIHYNKNEYLLDRIPHIKFLDLAIVFYYLVETDTFGNATILIYNSHLEAWGETISEIYRIAKKNTQNILKFRINQIEDILNEELGEELWEETTEGDIPMYVLSNQTKLNGAACMLYPDVLKDFANKLKSNLFLLPSSVHEIIVIPKKSEVIPEELKEMVKDVNNNHVEEEEILSFSVYEYLLEEDRIKISL